MAPSQSDLLIVDDDEDLRLAVADLVEAEGERRVMGVGSLAELVALGPRALACGLIIIDVNLGPDKPSGIDVLAWLCEHGYRGRAVFLTGHGRTCPEVEQAYRTEGVPVLSKPIGVDALLELAKDAP
jgi:FixJ family two-component response regulator